MRELGKIVRLQVQVESIKIGTRPLQTYTPEPHLTAVPTLRIDADGVQGVTGADALLPDTHNRVHPRSKFSGDNGISVGFTGHYGAMRDRFGDHVTDGIAGENMLVAFDDTVPLHDIEQGIVIVGKHGEIRIGPWVILNPCAPFSKFCLQLPGETKPDRRLTEALQFLQGGLRGFSAIYEPNLPPAEIHLGDVVYALD